VIHLNPVKFRTRTSEGIEAGQYLAEGGAYPAPCPDDGHWLDLWHMHLDGLDESVDQALKELRPSELELANKIRVSGPRNCYILDHAWRNKVLSLYGSHESGYTLRRSRLGKDWLCGENAPSVSFSRTGSRAVAAISNLARIGVDIEDREQPGKWLSIAGAVDNREWPAGCTSSADRAAWICRQFVIKEALLKGIGIGLRFPLHAIEVGFSETSTQWFEKSTRCGKSCPMTWQVISEMKESHSLAVAIKAMQPPVPITISQYHCASLNAHKVIREGKTIIFK
jgi:phosphopantetheinyl transferase